MNTPSRIVTPERRTEDGPDNALRPQLLSEFVGQAQARKNLSIFIEAARKRGEALDHVLFVGPPGLGKTTLAQIVARELGVGFRATSGPVIAKAGDLAALLTNLEERDVLFIDEIHRLSPAVEEVLYPAMEDFQLDLIIGEGPAARSVKIELAKFTLVGAAGLDAMDRRYLTTIAMNYGGGPVGVETMAAALSEPRDAIEDIIEPFLIQCGYLQRTPRGRLLTSHAFRHLGLAEPARDPAQFGLFGQGEEE